MSIANESQWNVSTDIYEIVDAVNNLKKRYIPDVDETTLSLGIFGFLTDTESKKIQTASIIAGELGNEMFPQRAKLDKNIITHAMYSNITNLNAYPSTMTIVIGAREKDIDKNMRDDKFIFDRTCPIYVGDYEFHLDYDIILKRHLIKDVYGKEKYFYNAEYDMDEINPVSTITNKYLTQPYTVIVGQENYIFFSTVIRQVKIEVTEDRMITGSIIDNKSFVFNFSNQLVDFDVKIKDKNEVFTLKPILYGAAIPSGVTKYCWYLYINDNTVRISFDSGVYVPTLNSTITITAQTTLGTEGNFTYNRESAEAGFYFDMTSAIYGYKKITCFAIPNTDAINGRDRKSIKELKELIPKMSMSRGYITTETDLNNYFNLLSTEENRLKLQKKVDNQLERIWYCYLLIKDEAGNVIPTNTIPLFINSLNNEFIIPADAESELDKYTIPAGTTFKYDTSLGYAIPINEELIPEIFSDEYFNNDGIYYYKNIYDITINMNPLFCSYYLSLVDMHSYFENIDSNDEAPLGFITTTNRFRRKLLTDRNEYQFTFTGVQSVNEDFGLITKDTSGVTDNTKIIMIIYKDGKPYKYALGTTESYKFESEYQYNWKFTLETDNQFDSYNNIKITNVYEIGYDTELYGYFGENCEASIFILGKLDREYGVNGGRGNLDKLVPNLSGYTLFNEYKIENGLTFFNNFTSMMNTKITPNSGSYTIDNIPMVGCHYLYTEDHVSYFINQLAKKKAYIDDCLLVLENNMGIDFKYFNTYGWSKTYTIGDMEETSLGNIDITLNFRMKLTVNNDGTIKDEIIRYIKDYIEDLNDTGEDLHFPNLISDIMQEYQDSLVYIEFMNFNDNRLGLNHIELKETDNIHIIPEFINVRNRWNDKNNNLEPIINIEIVL